MKKIGIILLCGAVIFQSCGSSNLVKGTAIGTGAGAAVGALAGYLLGGDAKGAAIGAAVGSAVGAGTGSIIGNQMDKKAEELKELENAQVETITDVNGLTAIKVTFESGILFPTNGTKLSSEAKTQLDKFAAEMSDLPYTDIAVFGHTDNTGTAEVNERISLQRANAVSGYLQGKGIAEERLKAEGHSFNEPIASNDTAEGRAQNRRVEIFIYANEKMIEAAEEMAKAQE